MGVGSCPFSIDVHQGAGPHTGQFLLQ